uniref:limulus clotting factor C n=1 Tax=Oncocephalus sp. TaxID=2944721 RepID=A0AB38ZEI2_9HEMI
MRAFGVVICLGFIACSMANLIQVPSESKPIVLMPQTGPGVVETRFDLQACTGCKMVLTCAFQIYSCRLTKIAVYDGLEVTEHCPETNPYVFRNSWKSVMTVSFANAASRLGAFCQVVATRRYLDLPQMVVDSSEQGLLHNMPRSPNTCDCGWVNRSPRRIVRGKETEPNQLPYQAQLITADTKFGFCGGSIISVRHVLTAAHCTEPHKERQLAVRLGGHDILKRTSVIQEILIAKTYEHENYNTRTHENDIAILELVKDILFNTLVGPICLPNFQTVLNYGQTLKVSGWGRNENGKSTRVLMATNLNVMEPEVCETVYRQFVRGTQVCTYHPNTDSCQGDSGGPLAAHDPRTDRWYLAACVSFGTACTFSDPAVNTNIQAFLRWIQSITRGLECLLPS